MSLLESGAEVGKYTILGKLATGGMSEIYLARQTGLRGFSKVVVLKLILPHLAANAAFMAMFANEAKLAALLNHPNVIQVFDYGEERGRPYIAMEYIDGRNLNRIGRALQEMGEPFPLSITLRIISDTAGALAYAHDLRDGSGERLTIIHRDVSRENILVTYSGQVKLVDFGIAKAVFLDSQTTEGTLKGKFAYMAPEMVRGEEPDERVDVYALGVTFYAMVTGKLPFQAKNHAELLNQIVNVEPRRPQELDPTIPDEVEDIIVRAMHKDREERYQRASDVQTELEQYLLEHQSSVMPYHLAQFMSQVFPPGSDQDRETYQSLTSATPHSPALARPLVTGPLQPPPEAATVSEVRRRARPRPGRRVAVALLLVAGFVAGGWAAYRYLHLVTAGSAKADVTPAVARDSARPRPAPPDVARASRTPDMAAPVRPPDAAPVARAPDAASAVTPPRPARRVGYLSVDAPGPGEVYLGRKLLGPLPLARTAVPAGRHRITVRSARRGYQLSRDVVVGAGKYLPQSFTVGEGTIRILVHPWAKVTLNGKLLGITPLKPIKVPEGVHELVFENSDLDVKRRQKVQVKPGQVSEVKLNLE